jgi:hypothetical protein
MKDKADELTRNIFVEVGIEKPSENFKANLMEKINVLEKSKTKVYEPILSRKSLIWIISIFASFIVVLLLLNPESNQMQFPFEFNVKPSFPSIELPEISFNVPDYNIPSIWFYVALAFPMFFVFERIAQKLSEKKL